MRISILKIILLFALEESEVNNRIRFSYEEISADTNLQQKIVIDSIGWLIRNDILFPYLSDGNSKLFYLNKYCKDSFIAGINKRKWVELSNPEILIFLKKSSNQSVYTIDKLKKILEYQI